MLLGCGLGSPSVRSGMLGSSGTALGCSGAAPRALEVLGGCCLQARARFSLSPRAV